MKLVKDYMKRKVIFFKPDNSIFEVAQTLSKCHISGAPVVEKNKVVGVISETNIIEYDPITKTNITDEAPTDCYIIL
jgi:predicted transcriptional regulator